MLRPGKGVSTHLDLEVMDFLQGAIEDVWNAFGGQVGPDADAPEDLLTDIRGSATHWIREDDSFGKKVYKEAELNGGTLRVTVMVTKKNELKIDIRNWFEVGE